MEARPQCRLCMLPESWSILSDRDVATLVGIASTKLDRPALGFQGLPTSTEVKNWVIFSIITGVHAIILH